MAAAAAPPRLPQLELDLDVFAGPFDLLMSLILRDELDLKSRLMLPGEELPELDELAPAEAAEELLARMLQYARFRGAGGWLRSRGEAEQGCLYRMAPLPAGLRRA